ncbi:MAG TPA: hypothetical protein DCQ64_12110, partial [Candidatus Rokubacteria bacterium]|nr:hypothetical protein [Candidatus Rokubacteria bacterium]
MTELRTVQLTAADFQDGQYVGAHDLSGARVLDAHLEIAADLGWVRFLRLRVRGRVRALAGTGIKAGG